MEPNNGQEIRNHWGLTHWLYGIKEYTVDRCLFCATNNFNLEDEDRIYKDKDNNHTTDCCCIWVFADCETCCFNNPIGALLCFPFALSIHLLCLPVAALCGPNKETAYRMHHDSKSDDMTSDCITTEPKYESYSSIYPYNTSSFDSDSDKADELHRKTMRAITTNNLNWYNSPYNLNGWNSVF